MSCRDVSLSLKLEEEHPVHQQNCDDGGVQDRCDGDAGGAVNHGQVQDEDGVCDQVRDEEPVRQTFRTTLTKVKPKNLKISK